MFASFALALKTGSYFEVLFSLNDPIILFHKIGITLLGKCLTLSLFFPVPFSDQWCSCLYCCVPSVPLSCCPLLSLYQEQVCQLHTLSRLWLMRLNTLCMGVEITILLLCLPRGYDICLGLLTVGAKVGTSRSELNIVTYQLWICWNNAVTVTRQDLLQLSCVK